MQGTYFVVDHADPLDSLAHNVATPLLCQPTLRQPSSVSHQHGNPYHPLWMDQLPIALGRWG